VRRIGRVAARTLDAEGQWKVAAVFRRSFYCESRGGSFICLGPESLGLGPLNLLCELPAELDWQAEGVVLGLPVERRGGTLRTGGGATFLLDGAEEWEPIPLSGSWCPATLRQGLAALAKILPSCPDRGGLQPLIPFWIQEEAARGDATRGMTPLLQMALAVIEPLGAWLRGGLAGCATAGPAPDRAIRGLIGLGPGLTPSGDDFLGGVLVTLRHAGRHETADRLAAEALAVAERGTHGISRAHLAAAADGVGAAALHAALASLSGPDTPRMGEAVSAIDAIGHSSGWDALAGVVYALAQLARAESGVR
jgi:hypothetical protein